MGEKGSLLESVYRAFAYRYRKELAKELVVARMIELSSDS